MFLALSLANTMNVAQLIVAVALSVVLLLQVKGSGFGAGLGGSSSVFRTRRGIEKTLFQLTVVLVVLFVVVSIFSARAV